MFRSAAMVAVAALLATGPVLAEDPIVPDQARTPGLVDQGAHYPAICRSVWKASNVAGKPPIQGGHLTYSRAARVTPQSVKEQAFQAYGIQNPNDGGHSYEIDHRLPLSLGGRDQLANLWPETRTASEWSAWIKDRLEVKLWNQVCHPKH